MPKMKFNTRVKYKNNYYKALEPFEVDCADVQELQEQGGVVIVDECRAQECGGQEDCSKKNKKKA